MGAHELGPMGSVGDCPPPQLSSVRAPAEKFNLGVNPGRELIVQKRRVLAPEYRDKTERLKTTEAEDIKERWQEQTDELYKKDLHDPDNHDGVITHPEPDIPECEVKWAVTA